MLHVSYQEKESCGMKLKVLWNRGEGIDSVFLVILTLSDCRVKGRALVIIFADRRHIFFKISLQKLVYLICL